MMWFTADTHFGHEGIIRLTHRPYESTEQMNRALIENINKRVGANDHLYVLGDFSYRCTEEQAYALRKQIRCKRIHLVRGNHDFEWARGAYPDAFASEQDYLEIKPGFARGHRLALFHYPMLSWNGKWRGAIHLHGHVHTEGPDYNERNRDRGILRYDVGMDANGYAPVSLDTILTFFDGVRPVPSDGLDER